MNSTQSPTLRDALRQMIATLPPEISAMSSEEMQALLDSDPDPKAEGRDQAEAIIAARAALAAADATDQGQDLTKWYTLAERLPGPGVSVLVAKASGHVSKTCMDGSEFIMPSSEQPTHWMPLPKAPVAARPAPIGAVAPDAMRALIEAHDLAMKQTLQARIPECGDFGAIAQNLAFVLDQMRGAAAPAAPTPEPTQLERHEQDIAALMASADRFAKPAEGSAGGMGSIWNAGFRAGQQSIAVDGAPSTGSAAGWPKVTPELRRAAEDTRMDLGPTGANYPHIRALLAFTEAHIATMQQPTTQTEKEST